MTDGITACVVAKAVRMIERGNPEFTVTRGTLHDASVLVAASAEKLPALGKYFGFPGCPFFPDVMGELRIWSLRGAYREQSILSADGSATFVIHLPDNCVGADSEQQLGYMDEIAQGVLGVSWIEQFDSKLEKWFLLPPEHQHFTSVVAFLLTCKINPEFSVNLFG